MRPQFQFHKLTADGQRKAQEIAEAFDELVTTLEGIEFPTGRLAALVLTKLEEACFFAKKAMAERNVAQE